MVDSYLNIIELKIISYNSSCSGIGSGSVQTAGVSNLYSYSQLEEHIFKQVYINIPIGLSDREHFVFNAARELNDCRSIRSIPAFDPVCKVHFAKNDS